MIQCSLLRFVLAAGLGDLRNNHDPRVTFEGDNTVLLQQTSNWLLKLVNDTDDRDFTVYPLSMVGFIRNSKAILSSKFTGTTKEDVCRLPCKSHLHHCPLSLNSTHRLQLLYATAPPTPATLHLATLPVQKKRTNQIAHHVNVAALTNEFLSYEVQCCR